MNSPRQFTIVLRAERGVDAVRVLRALLKIAGRRFGLKCLSCAPADEIRHPPGEAGHEGLAKP